jgi:xylulokinase
MPYFLAIDLGTTSAKVLLVGCDGVVAARGRIEFNLRHPQPTWAEANPDEWWKAIVCLVSQVLHQPSIRPDEIAAIGLSGLMHALVPVDGNGNALDFPMLWMDQRCKPQRDWLIAQFGDRIKAITGGLPSTTTSSPKLRWLVENRPDIVRQTRCFLLPKDFIRFKLTGELATDVSDSRGTSLIDQRTGDWSKLLLEEVIGVSAAKMPPIRQSTEIAGRVTASAATETGLRKGTPVVVGASDVRSTLIGGNAYLPHRIYLYMGTAAWLALSETPEDTATPEMNLRWLGATAALGASVKWFKEVWEEGTEEGKEDNLLSASNLQSENAYEQLDQIAANCPPGADGLIFLPHLMGERAPRHNPDAKGSFCGLTLAHRKPHLIRAIFEGNGYLIRHIIDTHNVDPTLPLFVMGGGAKSKLWRQILSNICSRRMLIPHELECGGLGAAMIAAVGTGYYPSLPAVGQAWVSVTDEIAPDETLRATYERGYQLYRDLDAALEAIFLEAADSVCGQKS